MDVKDAVDRRRATRAFDAKPVSDGLISELIEAMARRQIHLAHHDVELGVKEILEYVSQSLATGERIEIRGFGSFALNYRPPRVGRNPKSGEKVEVPEKWVPHFKAGKELRERVDAAPE